MFHYRWNYNKTIKDIVLTKHHWNTLEITWYMVNGCKEIELQYTGENATKHFGRPNLINIRMNSIFLHMRWKNILDFATQPIS